MSGDGLILMVCYCVGCGCKFLLVLLVVDVLCLLVFL